MTISTFDHVLQGDLDGLRVISPSQIFSFCSSNPKHLSIARSTGERCLTRWIWATSAPRRAKTGRPSLGTGRAVPLTFTSPAALTTSQNFPPSRRSFHRGLRGRLPTLIPQICLKCNRYEMFPTAWTPPANGTTEPTTHLATQERIWCTGTVFRHPPWQKCSWKTRACTATTTTTTPARTTPPPASTRVWGRTTCSLKVSIVFLKRHIVARTISQTIVYKRARRISWRARPNSPAPFLGKRSRKRSQRMRSNVQILSRAPLRLQRTATQARSATRVGTEAINGKRLRGLARCFVGQILCGVL